MKRGLALAALASCALVAGCGSTVTLGSAGTTSAVASEGLGLGVAPSTAATDVGTPGSVTDVPTVGATSSAAPTQAGPSLGPNSDLGYVGLGGGATVRTTKPFSLGVVVTGSDASVAGSIGASNAANGDERTAANTVIADINAHGGFRGRKVVPVFYTINPSTQANESESQIASEMCAMFTQDNHVEAVAYRSYVPEVATCLAKVKVPYFSSAPYSGPTASQQSAAPLTVSVAPTIDARAKRYAQDLIAQGFFTKSKGTGLVVEDRPEIHAVATQVLIPALKAAGVNVEVVYSSPSSLGNTAQITAQMSSAVLKWKQTRDRVMFLLTYSYHALSFMEVAQQQGYHPRYGLDSGSTPQVLAGDIPAAQLHRAVGVGVSPAYDAAAAYWRGDPPGRAHCIALTKSRA